MFSDKLGSIGGVKGRVKVELFNDETLKKEYEIEKDNLVLNEFGKASNNFMIRSLIARMSNLTDEKTWLYKGNNINFGTILDPSNLLGMLYLSADANEPIAEEMEAPIRLIGYAGNREAYSGTSVKRGTINLAESYVDLDAGKMRFVFDFPSQCANGTFQSLGFAPADTQSFQAASSQLTTRDIPYPFTRLKIANEIISTDHNYANVPYDEDESHFYVLASNNRWKKIVKETGQIVSDNPVKKADGTTTTAYQVCKIGNDLFFCNSSSGGSTSWLKIANADVTALPTAVSFLPALPATLYGLCDAGGGEVWLLCASNAIDTVVGEAYYNYIYKVNVSTMVITGRIRRNLLGALAPLNGSIAHYLAIGYDSAKQRVYLLASSPQISSISLSNAVVVEMYDELDSEYIGSHAIITGSTGATPYNSYLKYLSQTKRLVLPYLAQVGATPYKAWGCEPVSVDGVCTSKVLLPAPVTKLNTQTLKITYDIIFGVDIF